MNSLTISGCVRVMCAVFAVAAVYAIGGEMAAEKFWQPIPLVNHDFRLGTMRWQVPSEEKAKVSLLSSRPGLEGGLRLEPLRATPDEPWAIQLQYYLGKPAGPGTVFRLFCHLRAEGTRRVTLCVQQAGKPWTRVVSKVVKLSQQWQKVALVFKIPDPATNLQFVVEAASSLVPIQLCGIAMERLRRCGLVLSLDPAPRQIIKGWGIYAGHHTGNIWSPQWSLAQRAQYWQVISRLPFNMVRVDLRPEYYDPKTGKLNRLVADLLELLQCYRHVRPNMTWIASVWSPPKYFKDPPTQVGFVEKDGQKVRSRLRPDREKDFCRYLVDVLLYLRRHGIAPPSHVSIQNEPGHCVWYESCYYDRNDISQYLRVNRILRDLLDQNGFQSVRLLGPDINHYADCLWMFGDNFAKLTAKPENLQLIDAIASHSYDDWESDPEKRWRMIRRYRDAVNQFLARNPGREFWMTEYCIDVPISAKSPFGRTIYFLRHFARDLGVIPNSYWFGWHVPGLNVNYHDPEDTLEISPLFSIISLLWRLVPPGSRVYRLRSSDPGFHAGDGASLDAIAFAEGDNWTFMLINPKDQKREAILHGVPAHIRQLRLHQFTAAGEVIGTLPVRESNTWLNLPPQSVSILTSCSP